MPKPLVLRDRRSIITWLLICAALVALMVLIGGYTRLSGSGLSITEWKPIHGAIPPLGEIQWQEEFDAYRASPQYLKINKGMSLDEFKTIFWPEFIHRLLGRAIGIVFFIPLIVFWKRGSLTKPFALRLLGIFALGGLQGLIGWLMVKSGLVNDPHVSHLRLALHLSVAFAIYGLLLWAVLSLKERVSQLTNVYFKTKLWFKIWFGLLCLQIVYGAFMAGLHAGQIYNTYPTMNGQWIPYDLIQINAGIANMVENITMVQFIHRTLAVLLVVYYAIWWYLRHQYVNFAGLGKVAAGVAFVLALQFALGVATLVNQAPLDLALAHQGVALALFTLSLILLHGLVRQHEMK